MKYLLFGTGNYYERYKKWFAGEDVAALLDNSLEKQNTLIDGIQVLSPEDGIRVPHDRIVILSFFVREMKEQLHRLGVPENKIFHFYDMHQMIYRKEITKPIQYYGNYEKLVTSENDLHKKILLLSQDLELGGPAIALFHAAGILKGRGYDVVYGSMIDGPLKEKLLNEQIPIVIDVNLQIETMNEADWVREFDLIICNTVNFHIFLSERDIKIPIIWWLHDPAFFYAGVRKENMEKINTTNLRICSVGPFPEKAIHEYISHAPVERLLYGVADEGMQGGERDRILQRVKKKLRFTTIGYINSIKGQDILINAIKLIPEKQQREYEFYFVGQNSSPMAQQIMDEMGAVPEIKITGIVDRKQINEILNESDVLVCPSRSDAMPTVCAEAMMHGVSCLVSDATGTAEYIEDGVNGLIFQSENAQMLSEKIEWCIQNEEKLYQMGKRARKIYDQYFSMDVFERDLLELVESSIGK